VVRGSVASVYISGCSNGAIVCSGNNRNAVDPRTGQILTATGAANTAAAIGTVVPGTGVLTNGIRQAGDGIAKTSYVWPRLVVGPRFGAAYDLFGTQRMILRGGAGLFYDRPDGNDSGGTRRSRRHRICGPVSSRRWPGAEPFVHGQHRPPAASAARGGRDGLGSRRSGHNMKP